MPTPSTYQQLTLPLSNVLPSLVEQIMRLVCERFSTKESPVTAELLKTKKKYGNINEARKAFALICYKIVSPNMNYLKIYLDRTHYDAMAGLIESAMDDYNDRGNTAFKGHINWIINKIK